MTKGLIRHYGTRGEGGLARANYQQWPMEIKARPVQKFGVSSTKQYPLIRKVRE